LLAALGFGLAAGRWPLVAATAVVAVVIAALMIWDLAVGIVVFTFASFAAVLSLGGVATGAKGIGFVLVVAWAATLALRSGREARSLLRDQRWLVAFAVGLVAWSILSAAWAQSPSKAIAGASRYAQDLVLLPILYTGLTRAAHVRRVAGAFVVGALLSVGYSALTGGSVDSRLTGALGDPNETAAVMVAAAVLAVALAAGEEFSPARRAAALVAAAAALVGLAGTVSRGGVLALGATGIAAVVMAGRWRRQAATLATVGAVLLVAWFAVLAPASSRSHITSTQSGRTTLWTLAERAIAANPVVGLGNDNFSLAAKNFLVEPGVTNDAREVVIDPHVAHNVYLELWADLGIVGLMLFAGFVALSLRAAATAATILRHAGRRADEIMARALVVAIVGMLAADFFISDLYSKQLFVLLALAPAVLAIARREAARDDAREPVLDEVTDQ
jgi:O-antigen ligase